MKKRKKRKQKPEKKKIILSPEEKKGIWATFLFALSLIFLLSLFNLGGNLGNYLNEALSLFFGWTKFLLPLIFVLSGFFSLIKEKKLTPKIYLGFILFFLSLSGLFHLPFLKENLEIIPLGKGGGYLGYGLDLFFSKIFGLWGTGVLLLAIFFSSLILSFNLKPEKIIDLFLFSFKALKKFFRNLKYSFYSLRYRLESKKEEGKEEEKEEKIEFETKKISQIEIEEKKSQKEEEKERKIFPKKIELPLDLLTDKEEKPTSGDIKRNIEIIQKTLANFGIPVEMGEVNIGPTVTQYTLKPAEGIRLSSIVALANDLALALAAHPIRIEAPIPGKSLVGIEVPNQKIATVYLKEILQSPEWRKRKSNLSLALGKDVSGRPQIVDLKKMPHLLVAGATGSGKSVCLNAIILTLLYQNSPEKLKFILVDPKRVELPVYNGIPYLLVPTITEVKKTINALRWALSEMERRYELLEKTGNRDFISYNQGSSEPLPYLIIIIDELADLMVSAGSEVEACIIRIAQMARAVGIHLIIATQRPSVDIITGLIKANITSRIAFSVASAVDSRTILDVSGAEKLLGRGDMLFISPELSKPKRIQGSYVPEEDIKRVVEFIKAKGEVPSYQEEITEKRTPIIGELKSEEDDDELLEEAKKVILEAGKASASLLQRRLKIGYARAARILDILEEKGIIGPAQGAKPREILLNLERKNDDENYKEYD